MKSQTQIDSSDSTLQFRKLQNAQIDCQTQKIQAQIRWQNLMSTLAGRQYQKNRIWDWHAASFEGSDEMALKRNQAKFPQGFENNVEQFWDQHVCRLRCWNSL